MKTFFSQLRWLFSPQDKRRFIFIAILMAFSALLELAGIGVLLAAATLFLSPENIADKDAGGFLAFIFPETPAEITIACAVAGIGILLAAKNIFAYFIIRIQSNFIFARRNKLAHRIYKNFLNADFESFNQLSPDYCFGSFIRLNDVGNLILLPLMQLLADIMVIFILAAASIIIFPGITIPGILFMLIVTLVTQYITKQANRKNGELFLKASIEENRMRQCGIVGEKTIKSYAKEDFFQNSFDRSYTEMSRFANKLYTLGQLPRLVLESASILLAGGAFAIMLFLDIPKAEILLTFAVLTAAIGRILPAMSRCHYNLTLIKQNIPQLNQIISILKELPQEQPSVSESADAGKNIEFKNISFAYKDGKKIFDNFNLTIESKSSLAVSGRSGKGKSTLIDLLMGLLKVADGSITAGGIDISGNLPGWRKQIGIVPQNIFLLEGTVAENVAFGEENIDIEKVRKSLAMAGLPALSTEFAITSQGNLSGGQRQRIGIARALYHDAKLLILDEATSALDAETENAFCEVLNSLKGKITLIVISHRESTLNICDQKLAL
ncbi:MAG: ABC transporter ATP-binding protein [Lentisphaeria bacterium]|nr:ABC transporter ATP-binding protein [Lentisphaeria bacterium]